MPKLIDRLVRQSLTQFAGRQKELEIIQKQLQLQSPDINVILIHGPGGIGKTSLLNRIQHEATDVLRPCLRIDARDVEPSIYGLTMALARSWQLGENEQTLEAILAAWRRAPTTVCLIDSFELLHHLEDWLKARLLAELPAESITILSGRERPHPTWETDPIWRHGSLVMGLRNLTPHDCNAFLLNQGIHEDQAKEIIRLSYGHPLTLVMLKDILNTHGYIPELRQLELISTLVECFAANSPSAQHREALEMAAFARVTNQELISAVLGHQQAADIFNWLARLTFMHQTQEGVFPHDLVRDAITTEVRWRTPERTAAIGECMLQHFVRKNRHMHPGLRDSAALDIFYLNRTHPLMRSFIDFTALGTVHCEPASLHDTDDVMSLVSQELGPTHTQLASQWKNTPGAQWWVVKNAQGRIMSAMLCLELNRMPAESLEGDPMIAAMQQWLSAQPARRPFDRVIFSRLAVARGGLNNNEVYINAIQTRTFAMWMSEPNLAAFGMCNTNPEHWQPMMSFIDFARIDAGNITMDDQTHGVFAHDWRVCPIPVWLKRMSGNTITTSAPLSPPGDQSLCVLAEEPFKDAVSDALKQWHDPQTLKSNPLTKSAIVKVAQAQQEEPDAALRRIIEQTSFELATHPKHGRFFKTVTLTYLRPAGSQELAAERLGLPFGTYRYQLRTAIDKLADALWRQETTPVAPTQQTH